MKNFLNPLLVIFGHTSQDHVKFSIIFSFEFVLRIFQMQCFVDQRDKYQAFALEIPVLHFLGNSFCLEKFADDCSEVHVWFSEHDLGFKNTGIIIPSQKLILHSKCMRLFTVYFCLFEVFCNIVCVCNIEMGHRKGIFILIFLCQCSGFFEITDSFRVIFLTPCQPTLQLMHEFHFQRGVDLFLYDQLINGFQFFMVIRNNEPETIIFQIRIDVFDSVFFEVIITVSTQECQEFCRRKDTNFQERRAVVYLIDEFCVFEFSCDREGSIIMFFCFSEVA